MRHNGTIVQAAALELGLLHLDLPLPRRGKDLGEQFGIMNPRKYLGHGHRRSYSWTRVSASKLARFATHPAESTLGASPAKGAVQLWISKALGAGSLYFVNIQSLGRLGVCTL